VAADVFLRFQGVIPSVAVFQAERGISLRKALGEIPDAADKSACLIDYCGFFLSSCFGGRFGSC
jgi:hypothetical protein